MGWGKETRDMKSISALFLPLQEMNWNLVAEITEIYYLKVREVRVQNPSLWVSVKALVGMYYF